MARRKTLVSIKRLNKKKKKTIAWACRYCAGIYRGEREEVFIWELRLPEEGRSEYLVQYTQAGHC